MAQELRFGWWLYRRLMDKFFSVPNAAAALHVSLPTLYRHFRRADTSELQTGKVAALASVLDMSREQLEAAWRSEPVEEPDMARKGINAPGRIAIKPDTELLSAIEEVAQDAGVDLAAAVLHLVKRGLESPQGEVLGGKTDKSASRPASPSTSPRPDRARPKKRRAKS